MKAWMETGKSPCTQGGGSQLREHQCRRVTEGSGVGDKVRGGAGARSAPQPGGCWSSKRSRAVYALLGSVLGNTGVQAGDQKAARGPPRENPPPSLPVRRKATAHCAVGVCTEGRRLRMEVLTGRGTQPEGSLHMAKEPSREVSPNSRLPQLHVRQAAPLCTLL